MSAFLCGAVNESPFVLRDGNRSRDEEVDFDVNPTGVYVAVHTRQWELACERVKMYPSEAATWVVRYCSTAEEGREDPGEIVLDGSGSPEVPTGHRAQRWRMLPLHASLLFNGPIEVVQALINANPKACAAADDQGMLPLHVAFRAGAPEDIVLALLSTHPEAIERVDNLGRLPSMLAPKECVTYRDNIIDAFVRGPSYYYWSVRVATADRVRGEIAMHARIMAFEERARTSADRYKELLERTGKHCSEEAESLLIENSRLKEQIAFFESKYECTEEKERVLVKHTNSLAERLRLTSLSEEHLATEVEKLETRLQDIDMSIRKIREVSMEEKQAYEDMVAHLSTNLVKAERKVRRLTEALDVKVKEANKMQEEEESKELKNDCQSGCEISNKHEKEPKNLNFEESEVEVVTNSIEDRQILFKEADELCRQLSVFQSVIQQSSFEEKRKADCQANMNSEHKVLGKAFEDSTVDCNTQGHDALFDTYISTNSFSSSVNTKSAASIPGKENQTNDDYETINTNFLLQSHIDMTLRELTTEQTSVLIGLDLSGNREQILEMLSKIPGLTKNQINLLVDVASSLVT